MHAGNIGAAGSDKRFFNDKVVAGALRAGLLRIGNDLGNRLGNGPAQRFGHDSLLDDHHR